MTEQEWLTSRDPRAMLEFIREGASERKLRLFACACCRQAWNVFVPPFAIRVVTAAEAFADGEVSARDLARVRDVVARATLGANTEGPGDRSGYLAFTIEASAHATEAAAMIAAVRAMRVAALAAADATVWDTEIPLEYKPVEYLEELAGQANLLRDIFGNPFRSVEFQLEWFTADVLALARGIYADRAFDRMPILADALQDAGCDDDDILNHCREAREHARGCWVVDLLLGKK